jgi:hypothetical protein
MGIRNYQMPVSEWFTYTELEIIQLVMEETDVRKKLYQTNQVGSDCNASDLYSRRGQIEF